MDSFTLIASVLVTAALAITVRVFWVQILGIIIIGQILYYIAIASFGTALIWAIGIKNDKEGFWTCWLYFAIAYTIAAVVFYLIVNDIISIGVDFIRKIFKIK